MQSLEVISESFDHVDKSFQAKSNASGFVVLPFLFLEVRTGDIQMRPCGARRHKFLEEQSGCQRPRQWTARVVEVGAGNFYKVLVFLGKRKFPKTFSMISSGLDHGANQIRIVSHHSSDAVAQRTDDRAREGCNIEDMG